MNSLKTHHAQLHMHTLPVQRGQQGPFLESVYQQDLGSKYEQSWLRQRVISKSCQDRGIYLRMHSQRTAHQTMEFLQERELKHIEYPIDNRVLHHP